MKMKCSTKECKRTKNVDKDTKLCPSCTKSLELEALQEVQAENANSTDLDLNALNSSYREMIQDGGQGQPKILVDMFGMLLSIVSKQKEFDEVIEQVKSNSQRIKELEDKVGKPDDVAVKLGICIKNLPLPEPGLDELDNVRRTLSNVMAPGVDVMKDVCKAVRIGCKEGYSGIVKVQLRSDESRASIMKSKKILNQSESPILQKLVIQKLKSYEELRMDKFCKDILKMFPDGQSYFVGSNGQIRRRTTLHQVAENLISSQ